MEPPDGYDYPCGPNRRCPDSYEGRAGNRETSRASSVASKRAHALGRYIVAEDNQRIIGHALLDPMRLEAIAHVFRLTIVDHPGFHNRGVGETLMRDLMNWAKQASHLQKIELLVRATNERAVRLYSKLGFIEEGRFRKRVHLVNGGFVDDLAMAWFPR
jgi:RimJ/RimL family protein N-acetyltransferase